MTPTGSSKPGRWTGTLLGLVACQFLALGACGCDGLKQMFWKTWLDQSQPIFDDPSTAITQIRESASIYDPPTSPLPKNATDPLPEDLEVRREDYRIAGGDVLGIQVYELFALNTDTFLQRRVSERGFISLPKTQPLYVVGLTEREVELAIGEAYRKAGVLEDPQVAVATAQSRMNRTFSAIGPFTTTGMFDIRTPDFRLLNALGLVGGLANPSIEAIHVIRTEEPEPPGPPPGGPAPTVPGPPAGPGAEPLPLPGAPGEAITPFRPPATRPDVGDDLEGWTPRGEPGPARRLEDRRFSDGLSSPGTGQADAARITPPVNGGAGRWRVVDNKWTSVPEPAKVNGAAVVQRPKTRVIRIPLGPLRNGEDRYNIVIRGHDVLVAPQPVIGEFYVMGNVNRPGVYSLTDRRITLSQAIIASGGFGPLAVPSRVQLIRRIAPDQQQMFLVDVGRIIEGKADDYVLKPYDTINVGTCIYAPFLAVLRNAFRATYGVGFVYDRNFADIDSYSARPNPHSR